MLKSLIKALVVVAGLIWAGMACAVGFGSGNVFSALGQPLRVEISLMAVSDSDKYGLTARLASPDAFKAAGLDYPYHLSKLKFDIVERGGQTFIEVTSKEAVNDSFINLLVEVSWSSGKLLREYTFLLDPPDYKPEQPKAEEVTPIEPVVAAVPPPEAPQAEPLPPAASAPEATVAAVVETASAPVPATTMEAAASAPVAEAPAQNAVEAASAASAPVPVPVAPETTPALQAAAEPTVTEKPWVAAKTIKVKRGDTLTSIASELQEPDVTLEQMLVALYRANANKFDGRNMNRLRAGKILTVPDQASYEKLSQTAAVKEIRIQTANWNSYRQKLAAASTEVQEQAPKQEAAGKISTSVADKTPAIKESAKEVLKLSKGETPGDKTVAGGGKAQESKTQAREETIAKEKSTQESNKRAAILEKNVKDMQKLVELKGAAPAASTAAPAPVVAASAVRPAKPKFATAPIKPEPSLLDDILDNPVLQDPMYLGGGAALLIGLGGLGFYFVRRRKNGGGGGVIKKKKLSRKL